MEDHSESYYTGEQETRGIREWLERRRRGIQMRQARKSVPAGARAMSAFARSVFRWMQD